MTKIHDYIFEGLNGSNSHLPLVVIDTGCFSQIAIQYVWINPYNGFGIGPPIGVFIHSINTCKAINKNIVVARVGLTYDFIQLDECPVGLCLRHLAQLLKHNLFQFSQRALDFKEISERHLIGKRLSFDSLKLGTTIL